MSGWDIPRDRLACDRVRFVIRPDRLPGRHGGIGGQEGGPASDALLVRKVRFTARRIAPQRLSKGRGMLGIFPVYGACLRSIIAPVGIIDAITGFLTRSELP